MSIMSTIDAVDVSDAWRQVAGALLRVEGHKGAHLVVRIANGTAEAEHTRSAVDALMAARGLQSIDTVANTIFPAKVAALHGDDPVELAERYRKLLPILMRLNRDKNQYGTYFGRMVSYPGPGGGVVDQLNGTIDKLRTEHNGRGKASSRYEVAYQIGADIERHTAEPDEPDAESDEPEAQSDDPGAVADADAAGCAGDGRAVLTYSPGAKDDRRRMGFPCLSLASFHLDGDTLHLAAHYRNQNVIERAYGNYLGLGRLHAYVARCTGLDVGELLVVSGHIELEHITGVPAIVHEQQTLPV